MENYKLRSDNDWLIGIYDHAQVPSSDSNYIAWLALGNTPLPADVPSLSELKYAKWEQIKQKRTEIENGGIFVGTKCFHTDSESRIKHIGLVLMGASIPAGLMWKTMDGTFIEMTQALAGQIFSAIATLDRTVFANAESHRIAMELSQTTETYDFSAGWPIVFTG